MQQIEYDNITRMKYRVTEDIEYKSKIIPPNGIDIVAPFAKLHSDGVQVLYKGFCYDGATGAPDTPGVMRPAAFHDFICKLVEDRVLPVEYRRQGDDMFRDLLIEEGFDNYLADIYHKAVVTWGEIKYGVN